MSILGILKEGTASKAHLGRVGLAPLGKQGTKAGLKLDHSNGRSSNNKDLDDLRERDGDVLGRCIMRPNLA